MSHPIVRQPAVAAAFYPGDALLLRSQVQDFLNAAPPLKTGFPKAIIAPHAGYIYSGAVAASAYKALIPAKGRISRVVLLGPAHRSMVFGLAISAATHFATPLGNVPVERDTLDQLVRDFDYVKEKEEAHALEHSLEVHLPFLQETLGQFKLIPLVVGKAEKQEVGQVLEAVWGGSETLIVISTDLSHYHDYATAQQKDRKTAEAIENFDTEALDYESACGRNPVKGLLSIATQHQLTIQRVDLRNSGDTAGSKDRVVGYGSWLLTPMSA